MNEIPTGWQETTLGTICDFISGGTPSKENPTYWQGDIPWISASTMHETFIDTSDLFISEEGLKKGSKLAKKDDLLLLVRGSMLWNKIPICYCLKDLAFNQDVKCIRLIDKEISSIYLLYWFLTNEYLILDKVLGTGIGAGKLDLSDLKSLKFIYPIVTEQEKIINILSKWDNAIEKQNTLIEKLEIRKRGLMQQLLTGKKRLKGFSGEWKKYSYKDILKEIKRSMSWDDNEFYKLISVRRRSAGLFHRDTLKGTEIKTKNLRPAFTGDFLISKMQIVHGASGLVTEEFNDMKISGSYIALIAKDKTILNIDYLNCLSKMPYFYHQTYISSYGVHIEKMTFDFDTFMSLSCQLPPLEEQTAIARILSQADKEIDLARKQLSTYQQQKKALMQQLLTGKTRVRIDS